jgi:urate oxidase
MRIDRSADRHVVRELTVRAMLTGNFDTAFTEADNSTSVATDTVKNIINVVSRENISLGTELFCAAVAKKLLDSYPEVDSATVTAHETKWARLVVDGKPHDHSFLLDSNGKPFAKVVATRDGMTTESGIFGFTFMKSTQSGWEHYIHDRFTTIPETHDRMAATAMEASWRWRSTPTDYDSANAEILSALLKVFATTYSASVQDSLYRMGMAALEAVPELSDISMACPNKHYLLINLSPFGLENNNQVFVSTDEPHGQIECTVGR